jgi:hypothetical protein
VSRRWLSDGCLPNSTNWNQRLFTALGLSFGVVQLSQTPASVRVTAMGDRTGIVIAFLLYIPTSVVLTLHLHGSLTWPRFNA